jgi:chemotaxis protein CheD
VTDPRRLMVRMAEQAVSGEATDVLVSLGLGSCIGLALVDDDARVAGLSHIVLPESSARTGGHPAKFADTAVPALIEAVVRCGASRTRLKAVLCGGAHMFSSSNGTSSLLQIGERNATRTLAELKERRIPVRARDVGGSSGRSIEVRVATGEVLVRSVGQAPRKL